jgi:polar amino acid transport system substrate-binding protein
LLVNIWNLDGMLVKFNNFAQKITGYKEEEVLAYKWINTIVPESHLPGLEEMFKLLKSGITPPVVECELYCKDGRKLDIIWSNYIFCNTKGEPNLAISVGMDITELSNTTEKLSTSYKELQAIYKELELTQQQLQQQLKEKEKLAYYDQLTGLPNRGMLWKQLSLEILAAEKNKTKVAVLFMDLDNFKNVNDSLGHKSGDELLKKIGNIISKFVNEDIIAARLGGDEFVLIIKDVEGNDKVTDICSRIINEFKIPLVINNREFYITASIGAVKYPEDGQNAHTLLKNADIAMYNAKEHGGNRYKLFNNEMNLRIMEKLELENGLRDAHRNNEFCIHYQPQISINNNKVVGVEALIRWNHPQKGLIPPSKFIPIAEETGLIIQIGEWILKRACEQFVEWKRIGIEPSQIAVNISAAQFEQSNFIVMVKKILEETGISPECLELEITESTAMKNLEYTIKVIKELRELNIKVSLDDFGTGYSSLNYLMRLPINTLKIDKSFLDNIKQNSNEELIAKAIISLAKKMRLNVVAEGVETNEQLRFLREQNCDIAQGYLFSKPVPEDEVKKALLRRVIWASSNS